MDTIYTNKFIGNGFITSVKYNDDGSTIYISDKDSHTITSVNSLNLSVKTTYIGHKGIIWNFNILPNNNGLISCSGDMSIIFWNIDGTIKKIINENGIPKFISNIDNIVVIYCEAFSRRSKSYIIYYDIETMEKIRLIEIENKITAFEIINNMIVAGYDDGNINLLNFTTCEIINGVKIHNSTIKSITLNSKKNNILTGSTDKTSKILDIELNTLHTFESDSPINFAIFYAKDKKVILGGGIEAMLVAMAKSETNNLKTKIYNVNSQKIIRQFTSHFGPLRCIDSYEKKFVTAGQDGIIKVHSFELFEGYKETINTEYMAIINKNDTENIKKNIPIKPIQKKIPGMAQPNSTKDIGFVENTSNDNNNNEEIKIIKRTLKLSNLPEEITENDLYTQFDIYGKIDGRIKIIKLENNNYKHNNSRSNIKHSKYIDIVAYINFSDEENAIKAIETKNAERFILMDCVVEIKLIEGKYYA